ncbi:GntR family transcriptional regulator [Streptomyces sp. NPDC021020]|uniref:GntR family transcriptional regulator n=1 Tax=Streptomyces sp. NPDC021020 TaxID=3365109 RepID=UPI00378CF3C8
MSGDFPQYVYVQVADQVEADIRSGRLPVGARLPNERDMGTQYGVAPGTARRAVAELRDRGLVATLPNKGTFVVAVPSEATE